MGQAGRAVGHKQQPAYEYSFLVDNPHEITVDDQAFTNLWPEMRINSHYQANRFYLEDGQILRDTQSIEHIPLTIVHGTRDVI